MRGPGPLTEALRQKVEATRIARKVSKNRLAWEAGVGHSTIMRFLQGQGITYEHAKAVENWLEKGGPNGQDTEQTVPATRE